MRNIDKPHMDVSVVYLSCIERVRNPDLKSRLEAAEDVILTAAHLYDQLAPRQDLHKIPAEDVVNSNINKSEMEKIYKDRMAKVNAPGRQFYSELMLKAKQGICPLCDQRAVNTLDHYLPKSKYPIYSVTPVNLVAVCSDCNKIKDRYTATCREEELIHPYYDDLDSESWLKANLDEESTGNITYEVIKPPSWDELKFTRVKNHFETLNLGGLYAIHAAVELTDIAGHVKQVYDNGGEHEVKDYLASMYKSRYATNINHWKTAMFKALMGSDWYCNLEWV